MMKLCEDYVTLNCLYEIRRQASVERVNGHKKTISML